MHFRVPIAGLVAAMAVGLASPVQAEFFTQQSTVNVQALLPSVTGAPIAGTTLIDSGTGRTFTNTYGVDASGDALVRAVGVIVVSGINTALGGTFSGITGPGAGGTGLVVAFALDGHTIAPNSQTVQFTSGGAGFWQQAGNFTRDDPTKWFANFANNIYSSALTSPKNIFIGNGDTLGGHAVGSLAIPSSSVNLSSINLGNQSLIQSTLLFDETFDPNHFIDTTPHIGPDGLLAVANQTSSLGSSTNQQAASDLLNTNTSGGGTAAQKQAVVNAIAAFFGLSNLGGANTAFADFGSGTATDYQPTGVGLNAFDFSATATVQLYSGATVPEPSAATLMAIGTIAIGLFARIRSNRQK